MCKDLDDLRGHAIVTWRTWDDETKRFVELETRVVKLPPSGDEWVHYGAAPRPTK